MGNMRTSMLAAALMLLLAACGAPGESGVSSGNAGMSGSGSEPAATALDPDAPVSSGPIVDTPGVPETPPSEPPSALVDRARMLLAKQLNLDEQGLAVESTNQQTWDESLGCPLPGRAYAEFGQFGYLIRLRSGEQTYDIHASQTGELMILCQDKTPVLLAGEALPGR